VAQFFLTHSVVQSGVHQGNPRAPRTLELIDGSDAADEG